MPNVATWERLQSILVKPSFVIFEIRTLFYRIVSYRADSQSAQMSKIRNDGLTRMLCSRTHVATVGVKGLSAAAAAAFR